MSMRSGLLGRATRVADDELRCEQSRSGNARTPLDMIDQHSCRYHPHFSRWLANHCEPRPQQSRPIKIVEPQQADVLRTSEPDLLYGRERSQSHRVVRAENCRGTLNSRQKLHRVKMPAFHVIVTSMNHRAVRADFGASQRLYESLKPVDRCSAGSIARDDPDLAVAKTGEITRRAVCRSVVAPPPSPCVE